MRTFRQTLNKTGSNRPVEIVRRNPGHWMWITLQIPKSDNMVAPEKLKRKDEALLDNRV
jgi:hypothetical protein